MSGGREVGSLVAVMQPGGDWATTFGPEGAFVLGEEMIGGVGVDTNLLLGRT